MNSQSLKSKKMKQTKGQKNNPNRNHKIQAKRILEAADKNTAFQHQNSQFKNDIGKTE